MAEAPLQMTPLHGATEGLVPVGAGCSQCQKAGLLVFEHQGRLLMLENQKDVLLAFEEPLVFEQQKDSPFGFEHQNDMAMAVAMAVATLAGWVKVQGKGARYMAKVQGKVQAIGARCKVQGKVPGYKVKVQGNCAR